MTRGDIGDAKKGAQTDAIKKALSYFSIGNRAYHGLLEKSGQRTTQQSSKPKDQALHDLAKAGSYEQHEQANGHQEPEPLATDQQKASIRKLYEHLGEEMVEDVAAMTYQQAKDAIVELSARYNQMKGRAPAPVVEAPQANGHQAEEAQSSIPSVKQLQARCTKLCGAGYWQAMLKVALKLADGVTLLDKDITIAHRISVHKYQEYIAANMPATP